MKSTTESLLQAHEFAANAGVTVRTLHHYDNLGLLKPTKRTAGGYRLYGERDFARLQQIATLKFIGLPLKQIKELLDRRTLDLRETLRLQREIISERREQLDTALEAIKRAESSIASGDAPDWEAFRKIVEVITMEKNMEWTQKYYSQEAREKLAQKREQWTPELQAKAEKDWASLIKDVETAISDGEDPASERAQALAARWSNLIEQFTGGDESILEGLKRLYADQANHPPTFKKPYSDEVGAFLCRAAEAHKKE